MYNFSTSILLHRILVLRWVQRRWCIRCSYLSIERPKMTFGTSSPRTRWFTDLPFFMLNDRSCVTVLLGMMSPFSLIVSWLCITTRQTSVSLMLQMHSNVSILHIIIPYLVTWAWWHVDGLLQRGPTCDFLSWLSRIGFIFEFLCQVIRGGGQFLLHGWLWISCRLDGVWGEAQVDVRDVILNHSWWWTRDVGLWISLNRS